jgi:phosphatidylserine decarboxylase
MATAKNENSHTLRRMKNGKTWCFVFVGATILRQIST